jgi:hypothetical protein
MTADPTNQPGRAAREEVAGVVDLFGALTREELHRALSELAFKRRTEVDESAVEDVIDDAVREYALVPLEADGNVVADGIEDADRDGGGRADRDEDRSTDRDESGPGTGDETLLIAGPAVFPVLPPKADDLPYILDVPDREIDRKVAGEHVERRVIDDVDAAIGDGDRARLESLLEVTYDLESWAPVEVGDVRDRIADAMEGTSDAATDEE